MKQNIFHLPPQWLSVTESLCRMAGNSLMCPSPAATHIQHPSLTLPLIVAWELKLLFAFSLFVSFSTSSSSPFPSFYCKPVLSLCGHCSHFPWSCSRFLQFGNSLHQCQSGQPVGRVQGPMSELLCCNQLSGGGVRVRGGGPKHHAMTPEPTQQLHPELAHFCWSPTGTPPWPNPESRILHERLDKMPTTQQVP